jgi:hypothetical protein
MRHSMYCGWALHITVQMAMPAATGMRWHNSSVYRTRQQFQRVYTVPHLENAEAEVLQKLALIRHDALI